MKRLVLVRHAQAAQGNLRGRDFDRPLDAYGERDAPEVAARLVVRGIRPQLIVSSAALRALATARAMAVEFSRPAVDIETVAALYAASEATWVERIEMLPSDVDTALLVGHNPEISALAHALCRQLQVDTLPPCAAVSLEYAVADWSDVPRAQPLHWHIDYPSRSPGHPHAASSTGT